jgi:serine/threonine-protein kinase
MCSSATPNARDIVGVVSPGERHSGDAGDPELVGRVIDGRYRLAELLGRGGIGTVYGAVHLTLRRPVAIKLVSPRPGHAMADRKRVEREAFATGRIAHPNCVAISDFGTLEDGTLFLVMELLSGASLGAVLEREGRLPVRRALHIMAHVLRGLGHAHSFGIVHRDLKPENVILVEHLGDRDFAKVLDFGLAKLVDEAEQEEGGGKLTQTGITFGTPVYMSPEQAFGGAIDHRTDLYSASVMLFELVAGKPPFHSKDMRRLLAMHATNAVPRIRDVAPDVDVSVDVELLIRRGLDKEPARRPQSAAEMLAAIEPLLAAHVPAPRPPPPAPSPGATTLSPPTVALRPPAPLARRGRRGAVALAGGLVAAVAIAIAVAVVSSGDGGPPAPAPVSGLLGVDPEPEPEPALQAANAGRRPEPTPGLAEVAADRVPDLDEIDALIARNRTSDATARLQKLRKQYPANAYLPFVIGNLYFDRLVWKKGFEAYRDAIALDPAYRRDPRVIANAIRSLASRSQAWRGVRFLEQEIGAPAIPLLEEVADSRSLGIRNHSRRLLARLRPQ